MLYIVATPIGNLEDITLRALNVLKKVHYILCEDTRRTKKLLFHYQISVPTYSFHSFNERKKEDLIISHLREGKEVALVSDAGMPLISDPGGPLVKRCREEGLSVTCIPGPSAVTTALALSGLNTDRFQFLGFFPKKGADLRDTLEEIHAFDGVSLFFEAPHRLLKTLKRLPPTLHVTLAKELTKVHETILSGSPQDLFDHLYDTTILGEYVLLLKPQPTTHPL